MKFIGTPNLYVRFANKYVTRVTRKKGIIFDADGFYETDNPLLIKILSQNFKVAEEEQDIHAATAISEAGETAPETKPENNSQSEKIYKCKYCDFIAAEPLVLGRHSRTHKKEGST